MLCTLTQASEALGFASKTSIKRLVKAGRLKQYLREKRGRAQMIETEPEGLPPLRDALRELTVARVGSPLWAPAEAPAQPALDWDQLAEVANAFLDLRQWGAPPWSGSQWATLLGCAELARLEVDSQGESVGGSAA